MMATLKKFYSSQRGLDLKSTDLVRPDEFATDMLNAQYTKSGATEKRPGFQAQGISQGVGGICQYNRIDLNTGAETQEVLSLGPSVQRRKTTNMTVSYAGAASFVNISILVDTTGVSPVYRCTIVVDGATSLSQSLGTGIDEASPYKVSSLVTAINAIAGFTAAATGSPTTTPAAFLNVTNGFSLKSTTLSATLSVDAYYWEEVNKTVTSPLSGSSTNKNASDFEIVSTTQLKNVIYLGNGYDETLKYDGQTVYRAGMPSAAAPAVAILGAGSIAIGTYQYSQTHIQLDKSNNLVEGNRSTEAQIVLAGASNVNVGVNNIEAGTGFNTNCALVNGNQVGVTTITVTNTPHTMKVGDTAFFIDQGAGVNVTREVLAVTATTIQIAGAVVSVNAGDVISNNLRIAIYRTKVGGTQSYLVAEIPNNSFVPSYVYVDSSTDAQLGAQFLEPLFDRSPPPKGKYLASFDGFLAVGGNTASPRTVFHSTIEGQEYFPTDGSHEDDLEAPAGDKVTGIGGTNDVFVAFSARSTHIYSGEIRANNYRVIPLTFDTGCSAHATIKDIRGALCFLSDRGPYSINNGGVPEPLGDERVEPLFDQDGFPAAQSFQLKRATAINDRKNQKYILFLPCEETTGGNVYSNSNSRVLAYDYYRGAWLLWNKIDGSMGFVLLGEELFWQERRSSLLLSTITYYLYHKMQTGDANDYEDNLDAITWNYKGNWEALGEPSVFKKFLRCKVFQLEPTANNQFMITLKTETDYLKDYTKGSTTLDFVASGGYGVSQYGIAPYGDFTEQNRKTKLNNGRFRSMRLVFENAEHKTNVLLTGWELEIETPFAPKMKD